MRTLERPVQGSRSDGTQAPGQWLRLRTLCPTTLDVEPMSLKRNARLYNLAKAPLCSAVAKAVPPKSRTETESPNPLYWGLQDGLSSRAFQIQYRKTRGIRRHLAEHNDAKYLILKDNSALAVQEGFEPSVWESIRTR
jgi:hypothetical protein